jgi:serine/threonine protein kinase
MEHVPGGTLRDLIVNMAQLPEAVASIYTHQLLLGLAFLHSCGAAHHTLCAANVSIQRLLHSHAILLQDMSCDTSV